MHVNEEDETEDVSTTTYKFLVNRVKNELLSKLSRLDQDKLKIKKLIQLLSCSLAIILVYMVHNWIVSIVSQSRFLTRFTKPANFR